MHSIIRFGRVKRARRTICYKDGKARTDKEKILSPAYNRRIGRWYISIRQHGEKPKNYILHRLIAETFCENDSPDIKRTVNHIDGNPSNNKSSNLEWTSYGDNLKHSYACLHRPHNCSSIRKRKCKVIDRSENTEFECSSIAEASRKTGLSETQIRRIAGHECYNKRFEILYA